MSQDEDLNERQKAVLTTMEEMHDVGKVVGSAQQIAWHMGLRPSRKHALGTTATLRTLEKRGMVAKLPPKDRWNVSRWFLTYSHRPNSRSIFVDLGVC